MTDKNSRNGIKAVLLLNPFTSVKYLIDFCKSKEIAIIAFFSRKQLKRSGYVKIELEKAKFDIKIQGTGLLKDDLNIIHDHIDGKYSLVYSFIGSEVDDYAYCELINQHILPEYANDASTAYMRYNKYDANEQLRLEGVNCVKQKMAGEYETGYIPKCSIVKPVKESCSEQGVVQFKTETDLINYLKSINNKDNLVVQEEIIGDEYIVDCFSVNGIHYVIGIQKYEHDNPNLSITQHVGTVNLGDNQSELIEYALSVLDHLNVKNGFAHIEIMHNADGCYLIELNPRLPGCAGFTSYLCNIVYNRHHIGVWYDLIVKNNKINKIPTSFNVYSTIFLLSNYRYGYQKLNIKPIESLKSFKKIYIIKDSAAKPTEQSRLNTIAFILLANSNKEQIERDIKSLIKFQDTGIIFD